MNGLAPIQPVLTYILLSPCIDYHSGGTHVGNIGDKRISFEKNTEENKQLKTKCFLSAFHTTIDTRDNANRGVETITNIGIYDME